MEKSIINHPKRPGANGNWRKNFNRGRKHIERLRFISLQTALICIFVSLCVPTQAQTNSSTVKTNFEKNASLTARQVQIALELATKAGLKDIGEIRTFNYIPGGGIGISVISHEHKAGRRITTEGVVEYCKGSHFLVLSNALRLQDFWINPPYIRTNEELEVTISGTKKRIGIQKAISADTADQIVHGLNAALSEYLSGDKNIFLEPNRPDVSQLDSLQIDHHDTVRGFEVYKATLSYLHGWRGYHVLCKLEHGKLVIVSFGTFDV